MEEKTIKLSIIIPTLGRTDELKSLLSTIYNYKPDFEVEVIVVDQNFEPILTPIIQSFKQLLNIFHYKVNFKGASKARNFGISKASGNIYCFPDDDCEFQQNTISIAVEIFLKGQFDVVFGKCVDTLGKDSVIRWSKTAGYISRKNCNDKFVEATMFAKKEIFDYLLYDETLGVGTFHGSAEAYDLVIRLLDQNKKLFYTPTVVFYHPNKVIDHSLNISIKRTYSYSCGFSKLCLKHKLYLKLINRLFLVAMFIPFSILFSRKKTRYYCGELLGILSGIIIK